MTAHSNEEITEAILKIWDEVKTERKDLWYESIGSDDFAVQENTPEMVRVRFAKMYSAPSLSFAHLKKLSAFFGTDNIDNGDEFSDPGCETCDYGSSYGFTIYIKP